jgi:hypothetical protein
VEKHLGGAGGKARTANKNGTGTRGEGGTGYGMTIEAIESALYFASISNRFSFSLEGVEA